MTSIGKPTVRMYEPDMDKTVIPAGDVTIGDQPGINARLTITDVADSPNRTGQFIRMGTAPGAGGIIRGIEAHVQSATERVYGVDIQVDGLKQAYGGRFSVNVGNDQSETTVGVVGLASGTFAVSENDNQLVGVYGQAFTTHPAGRPIGVYGEAFAGDTLSGLSGHFAGAIQKLMPESLCCLTKTPKPPLKNSPTPRKPLPPSPQKPTNTTGSPHSAW